VSNESVQMVGDDMPVRADNVAINSHSAHAFRNSSVDWLAHFSRLSDTTFMAHGKVATKPGLANAIQVRRDGPDDAGLFQI